MTKQWLIIRPQVLPISWKSDRRVPGVLLILTLITLVAMVISVGYGEYQIAPLDVVKTLLGLPTTNGDYAFIINTLRLPRTIVAFLVGGGMAIAGTITQGITRNPLAAPGIIGVNAGATLAAVTLLVLLPNAPISLLPFAAFVGALTVALLIYLLAWQEGSSPVRLILVGIGFNLIAGALTNLMITFGEINNVSQALVWLAGSVYGRGWSQVLALIPWIGIFGAIAFYLARELNTLNLGDEVARGLGSRVEWQRGLLLLTSVALAGSSVATAGAVGFVGLMAPHIGRQLVGASHEGLLPVAAMMGGMLVVCADLLGRVMFAPLELPCGIITAVVGAPYFVYLLIKNR
ncbi:iron-dicitrate transporter subunit; membrane component of ABC superfamily; KpLE2 phage-like element [Hyella patelloides LEGE 07179]|uniref:Iron-dicitrate transporter subunit membrane component of ABC superfamily KpLE2 phage-like element n=1 Tax=Hyella patelloides LEGE 07179 TaxID=945734 RepID=A0A563VNV9_9CYAN|nr:iron ABC transporter permease [Hyella patelloides]VEP12965.1 iron-dicitrate transporter subunit; membrane component of ABC superfamily; KpLE2 phage-like element [Hyella patelloides LEGE 07179]